MLQVRGDARKGGSTLVYFLLGILRGLVEHTDGVGTGLHKEVAGSLFLSSDGIAFLLRVIHLSLLCIPGSSQGVVLVAIRESPDYLSVNCYFILKGDRLHAVVSERSGRRFTLIVLLGLLDQFSKVIHISLVLAKP